MAKKTSEDKQFLYADTQFKTKPYPDFNIDAMYERVFDEMGLQQSKRDQLITIYLAALAFTIPALLESADKLGSITTGIVFMALGLLGFLFSLIIIRYRKYKEAYWICCRTLSVMMTMDKCDWTRENIQSVFYQCLLKKVGKLMKDGKIQKFTFIRKNINSGESLYLVINALISGSIAGLGLGTLLSGWLSGWLSAVLGVLCGLCVFIVTLYQYFKTLLKVYQVCDDCLEDSFNATFGDAWFLHFFLGK